MKNQIDSNFAIAILALISACVGFAFYFYSYSSEKIMSPRASVQSTEKVKLSDQIEEDEVSVINEDYQKYTNQKGRYSVSYPISYEVNGKDSSILISPKKTKEELENRIPIDGPAFGVFVGIPEERTVGGVRKLFLPRNTSGIETRYIVNENGFEVEKDDAVSANFLPFTHDNFEVIKYTESGFSKRVNYLIHKDDYLLHIEGEDYEDDLVMSILESVELLGAESAGTIDTESRISDLVVANGNLIYTLDHCDDGKKCSVGVFDGKTRENTIVVGNLQDFIPMRSHYEGLVKLIDYDDNSKILKVLHRSGGHTILNEIKDIDTQSKSVKTVDSIVDAWCEISASQGIPKCTKEQLQDREKRRSWWQRDDICKTIEVNGALIADMAREVLGSEKREDYFVNSILSECFSK